MKTRILACTDGSAATAAVCEWAAWSAFALDGKVEFAFAADVSPTAVGAAGFGSESQRTHQLALLHELSGLEERRRALVCAYGRSIVAAAEKHVGTRAPVGAGASQIDALLRIVQHTGDARLLVLPRELLLQQHGDGADTAPGCYLAAAGCSILAVDAAAPPRPNHVAIAFDGRITGRRMIEKLVQLPLYRGLRISLVMAGPPTPGNREQASWAAAQLGDGAALENVVLLPGSPVKVISGFLEESGADLLVLGGYHYASLRQNVVGSTMQHLLRWQHTPILVIR